MAAAADRGTYVCIHAHTSAAVQRALASGVKSIEHGQPADQDANTHSSPEQRAQQQSIAEGTARAIELGRKHKVKMALGADLLFNPKGAPTQGKQTDTPPPAFQVPGLGVTIPPGATVSAALDTTQFTATLLGGYRVVDTPQFTLDALAGARLWRISNDLTVTASHATIGTPTASHGQDFDWVDPAAGARAFIALTETLSLRLQAEIGGFGAGSDFSWGGGRQRSTTRSRITSPPRWATSCSTSTLTMAVMSSTHACPGRCRESPGGIEARAGVTNRLPCSPRDFDQDGSRSRCSHHRCRRRARRTSPSSDGHRD